MRILLRGFWLAVILAACGNGVSQQSQDAVPPFSIAISAFQDVAPAGAKLKVKAEVTNMSRQVLTAGDGSEIHWEVRASNGNLVPLRESFKEERKRDATRFLPPTVIKIVPGETNKWEFVISDMYELSQPGQYTMRAQLRGIDGSSAVATSNEVALTITPPEAQQARELSHASFSLEIDAYQDIVKAGAPVNIRIQASNTAEHDIDFDNALTKYSWDVLDSQGSVPALTAAGQRLQGLFGKNGDHHIRLRPGETKGVAGVFLQDLYDLKRPEQYTIQVRRIDDETKTVVKSNVITITVKP